MKLRAEIPPVGGLWAAVACQVMGRGRMVTWKRSVWQRQEPPGSALQIPSASTRISLGLKDIR